MPSLTVIAHVGFDDGVDGAASGVTVNVGEAPLTVAYPLHVSLVVNVGVAAPASEAVNVCGGALPVLMSN